MKRYRTIVADPPWNVTRSFGGANWRRGDRTRPELDYRTMTLENIAALPVVTMADDDCALFCWTVQSYLEPTFEIMRRWGFRPAATLVWCKPQGGFVGGAFYSNVEFVLYGRRGQVGLERVNSQWFDWPRGEHSAKPDAFYDLVEQISPEPRLELFARRARLSGWDYWGDESLGTVEMPAA